MPIARATLFPFAVTIFLSGLTVSKLHLFRNLSQSVSREKIDK